MKAGEAVVIADQAVESTGLLGSLLSGLEETGFSPTVFSEIVGEPDDAVVEKAVSIGRGCNPAAVVGIGGGSAMDTAKFVAYLTTNNGAVAELGAVLSPPNPVTPLALVPTTTGTGAEATRIAMVTVGGAKRITSCVQYVPLIAALDPDLVAGLPAAVVASTALDALAHALESTLSLNRTPLTVALAGEAAQIIVEELEPAVAGSGGAREKLLYGAYLAGLALNAGVVVGHSLGYVIARRAHLPHGVSCALALPYCLAYNCSLERSVARHIGRLMTRGGTDDLRAAALAVDGLAGRVGLPRSLEDVQIPEGALEAMAHETVRDYPRPNNPEPIEEQRLLVLLRFMSHGDIDGAWAAMTRLARV